MARITAGVSPERDSVGTAKQKSSSLAAYIYQDQRFKGQDEFLGENVAGGPAGRRCLRKTNDFRRAAASRRERVSRLYQFAMRLSTRCVLFASIAPGFASESEPAQSGVPIGSEIGK